MDRFTARFVDVTGAWAPSIGGAVLILVVGLLIAWALAALSRRAFARTQLDEKLARLVRGDRRPPIDTARWASRGVFWVVVLIALVGFFQALGFTPITRPMTNALDSALTFLPRLLAAAALALAAFLVASFLRIVVARGLDALRIDERLARRTADAPGPATPRIADALAQTVYYLTWLLFVPAILGALQLGGILGPVQGMVDKVLDFLPNVATAIVLFLAAFFVGRVVAGLVQNGLAAVGFDRALERVGLGRARAEVGAATGTAVPRIVPSRIAGTVAFVAILLFAAMEAFDVIAFDELRSMTADVIGLAARVLLGLIVFAAGWVIARFAGRTILATGAPSARILATSARVAILVLAGAMALRQMGLANEIIQLAFGLTLGGIAAAVAIAFGVGGRQVAGRELERLVEQARGPRVQRTPEPFPATH